MQSFDIYIPRKNIELEFESFLNNEKKVIWSIYGVGGIGKTTLINRFWNKLVEKKASSIQIDYPTHKVEKVSGLEILLYYVRLNECKNYEKIREIIRKKYVSIAQKLSNIGEVAGDIPINTINALIAEFDNDADYTKELGLVWKTVVDTIKVSAKWLKRDKKNEIISNNPELHLITALLADIEQDKKGVILIDTYEKFSDLTVSTTLKLIGNELISNSTAYEINFTLYIDMILTFLYRKKTNAQIKTIIAGRSSVTHLPNFRLWYIKQSKVNEFEPADIVSYIEKVKEFSSTLIVPNENIIEEIHDITNGNPLIIEYLLQFILVKYGDEWNWEEWIDLKNEFKNSDEEYGLIYYLTDRIATHITGWKNNLWKLTIPLVISPDIADILYPKQEGVDIYGKDYFKLLEAKGILRKGNKTDKNYYLFDELRACLDGFIENEFGKVISAFDHPEIIDLHIALRDYYDKIVEGEIEVLGDDQLNTQELKLSAYHSFGASKGFEKKFNSLGKNRFELCLILLDYVMLNHMIVRYYGKHLFAFTEHQFKELIDAANNTEISTSINFYRFLHKEKANNRLPADWFQNEGFLLKATQQFTSDTNLLRVYASVLARNKKYRLAESYYQKAIDMDLGRVYILYEYHNFLHENKDNFQANKPDEYYKKVVNANPNDSQLLNCYAIFLQELKEYDQADKIYFKAVNTTPIFKDVLFNYAIFLQHFRQDYDRAEEYYQKAIECNPNNVQALGFYATFLTLIRKDIEKANMLFKDFKSASANMVESINDEALKKDLLKQIADFDKYE